MKGKLLIFVAGLALAGGAALAGDRGSRPDFSSLDTDGDGRLSEAELDALPSRGNHTGAERLARLDTDGDDFVSQEEMQDARQRMSRHRSGKHGGGPGFEELDTDGDGRLSEAELDALPSRGNRTGTDRMARLDTDGDDFVSQEEMQAARQRMSQYMGRKHGGRPIFEDFDTDGDGRLSREEMSEIGGPRGGMPEEIFDRMDADGDGYVTPEERQALREQWRGGKPDHGKGGYGGKHRHHETTS